MNDSFCIVGVMDIGRVWKPADWSLQEGTVESRESIVTSPSCRRKRKGRRNMNRKTSSWNKIHQTWRKETGVMWGRGQEWPKRGKLEDNVLNLKKKCFQIVNTWHLYTHIDTHRKAFGLIQRSGQNSSPLIMQMNMTLAGLGTWSHQHPCPA